MASGGAAGGAAPAKILKLSPLIHKHLALKPKMAEWDSWFVPARYSVDARGEAEAALRYVGMTDISHLAKIDIRGPATETLLRSIVAPSAVPVLPGRLSVRPEMADATLKAMLSPRYVCRLARDQAMLVAAGTVATGPSPMDVALPSAPASGAYLTNVTSVFAAIGLTGPGSAEVISTLAQVDASPESLKNGTLLQAGLANVLAVIIRADGSYQGTPVPSYDILVGRENAEYLWDSILAVGGGLERVAPVGLSGYVELHENMPNGGRGGAGAPGGGP